jgi:hypothetical protein
VLQHDGHGLIVQGVFLANGIAFTQQIAPNAFARN